MTQEQKAKAYDEALERAKKMIASQRGVVIKKQALEAIFPELRESEVVRIKYGLPQLTKMRLCGDSARVHKWRHYLVKQRGYILGSDRYTFYYDENTRRSPKLEAGGNPFTFEQLKSKAI